MSALSGSRMTGTGGSIIGQIPRSTARPPSKTSQLWLP